MEGGVILFFPRWERQPVRDDGDDDDDDDVDGDGHASHR